jgi:hypothetical protein
MKLYPFYPTANAAFKLVNQGMHIYQQFNCGKCGAKQTMDAPDCFYKRGICEECGHETDIEKDGCNYMVHAIIK